MRALMEDEIIIVAAVLAGDIEKQLKAPQYPPIEEIGD
jgi:hypothetical protein